MNVIILFMDEPANVAAIVFVAAGCDRDEGVNHPPEMFFLGPDFSTVPLGTIIIHLDLRHPVLQQSR